MVIKINNSVKIKKFDILKREIYNNRKIPNSKAVIEYLDTYIDKLKTNKFLILSGNNEMQTAEFVNTRIQLINNVRENAKLHKTIIVYKDGEEIKCPI